MDNKNDNIPNIPIKPIGNDKWTGSQAYLTTFGSFVYTPSNYPPQFPCKVDSNCTLSAPKCKDHGGLFVKVLNLDNTNTTIEIPFGNWECWGWYAERIEEVTGIPVSDQRIIFAGSQCQPGKLHSGLQRGATIQVVKRLNG